MMVPIDRKFNEEQLLLETFFPKMHVERDICKKVISRGLNPIKKLRLRGAGVLICCLGHHSLNIFHTLPANFAIFIPHLSRASTIKKAFHFYL